MAKSLVDEISNVTGFKSGTLPIRYLGVPLITRRLTEKDCFPLLEGVKRRITNWATKFLSYAGRLQLLKSVIFSFQNFWCAVFMLPNAVIHRLTQMCTRFFWKGRDDVKGGAKVSWENICHPKAEGGLGLKNLLVWNKACMMKNLWAIYANAGSLWVAWIKAYVLKGRDILLVPSKVHYSWRLKKMLKLRHIVFDLLEPNGSWRGMGTMFKAGSVYDVIRSKKDKVRWQKLIWFSKHIPKHSLIAWLTVLNKLATKDRLKSWGLVLDTEDCILCLSSAETRDHLFFTCPFSKDVWSKVLKRCGIIRQVGSWEQELIWAVECIKGKSFLAWLLRIAWNAYCYNIWSERNARIHGKQHKDSEVLTCCIGEAIKLRLCGMKAIKRTQITEFLSENWDLQLSFS